MTRTGRRIGQNPAVNGFCGAILPSSTIGTRTCPSCLKLLRGKRRHARFCDDRCRLRAWAVKDLAGALEAGEAEGLRADIRKLGEAA